MRHFVSAALFILGIMIVAAAMSESLSVIGSIITAICGFAILLVAYVLDKETIDNWNKEARK